MLSITRTLTIAAETGLKGHDRLALARQTMRRKLEGRRTSSSSRPLSNSSWRGR
ncbi:hypothetical protein FVA81_02475 (plasmid) [Rhizobium sp. WL3]|nr:hypothetical protein FVA81_02475 [Rhizobium sp. WL3]